MMIKMEFQKIMKLQYMLKLTKLSSRLV